MLRLAVVRHRFDDGARLFETPAKWNHDFEIRQSHAVPHLAQLDHGISSAAVQKTEPLHRALRTTCCARRLTSSDRQRLVPRFSRAAAPAATAYRNDFSRSAPDASCQSSAPRKLSPAPTALTGVMGSGSARNT